MKSRLKIHILQKIQDLKKEKKEKEKAETIVSADQ